MDCCQEVKQRIAMAMEKKKEGASEVLCAEYSVV